MTELGHNAFAGNSIAELSLGSVTTLGQRAFESNALTSVVFPASVTFVGIGAFNDNPLVSAIFTGAAPMISGARARVPSLGSAEPVSTTGGGRLRAFRRDAGRVTDGLTLSAPSRESLP